MEQPQVQAVRGRLTSWQQWLIALVLLLLPLSIALYCYLPQYNSFSAPGGLVSIQDIGVKGSVHFVYVREGFTRNRYEKLSVRRSYPDAQFTRVSASAKEASDDMLDFEKLLKDDTIRHAVDSAADIADQPSSVDQLEDRENKLIEETSQYYGNSIGLMLGIGLYEEEKHVDFSKLGKLTIAGTGTLEEDQSVGSVGAIREKLRTAEAEGADIFLVPKDKETFMYEGLSNEEEALQVAGELHLRLRVVPVASLEEAIYYLSNYPKYELELDPK